MAKNIWIIANWKSNKTIAEALEWVEKVGPSVPRKDNLKVVICPTFSCLSEIRKIIQVNNFPLMLGSQDLSSFGIGAYTGEESAGLLKGLIDLSIIGHCERRKDFGESDKTVAGKVEQALENNITPLVCVQEEETPVPSGCKLVAYEPIFAIGTGNADTPENANLIADKLKKQHGMNLEILYGGSVNSQNVKGFISQENINGALVGNASLEAEEFVKICKSSLLD